MELGKYGCPSTRVGGPRQPNHHVMNAQISSNSHARQNQNEKKAFDKVKKKVELEWNDSKPKRNKWNKLNDFCWYV
jgi:hypothetical protein